MFSYYLHRTEHDSLYPNNPPFRYPLSYSSFHLSLIRKFLSIVFRSITFVKQLHLWKNYFVFLYIRTNVSTFSCILNLDTRWPPLSPSTASPYLLAEYSVRPKNGFHDLEKSHSPSSAGNRITRSFYYWRNLNTCIHYFTVMWKSRRQIHALAQ
jgi:hypothetical protein